MSRFPAEDHLASWAGLCPGNNESAGGHGNTRTGKGNGEIRTALIEAAWATARTNTYLGARFRRLHRRSGKKNGGKAAVAVAHNMLVIIWHVLRDGVEFHDLGADYFSCPGSRATTRRKDQFLHELRTLGYTRRDHPRSLTLTSTPSPLRRALPGRCRLHTQLPVTSQI